MKKIKESIDIAKDMLARYPRTVLEVKKKLKNRGFNEKIIEVAIKNLEESGLLSDEEYAKLWLENHIKYRPSGRVICRQKMVKRGLNIDLVNDFLKNNYTAEQENEVAYKLAKLKVEQLGNIEKQKKLSKLGKFLDRKGFPESIIWGTLEKMDLLN